MQPDRLVTAGTWLSNAQTDLALAKEIAERYPSRACFHAQQTAEMGLKAALIAIADDHPRTHIGDLLIRELQGLGENVPADVIGAANRLDLFYTGSRYPDALGGADPRKVLQTVDATGAVAEAQLVYDFAAALIERERGDSEVE